MAGKLIVSTKEPIDMINRDGQNTSLWQNTSLPFLPKNSVSHETVYDVAVAGGGITGILTALLLQKAGKQCIVLEAATLCFGTTGGTTAHINTLLDVTYEEISKAFGKDNAKLVYRAASEAIDLTEHHVKEYQIDCGFRRTEAYLFAQDEDQAEELQKIMDSGLDAGLEASFDDGMPVDIPFTRVMKASRQACFHPTSYVFALAVEFEKLKGVIVQNCRVLSTEDITPLEIQTTAGKFKARQLVYATHIPPGINLLHLRCVPYRSYAMAFKLADNHYPEGLIYDMYDPYHYYRSQRINDASYFIAGGYDHKTGHKENTEIPCLELKAHVLKYFKGAEPVYRWSSQYFEPADGLPYIGKLPGKPDNIFVACGYGGNGITYSHVAATVLRDLITEVESPYESLFDPNRIKPVAGFKSFIEHNIDVVKQFVSGRISSEQIKELAELAPEEGRIVEYQDQKLAIYKDAHSRLHAIDPVCTHLKCFVSWNATEKTWDCPCHGARYDFEGKVITGPAFKNLEKIDIS